MPTPEHILQKIKHLLKLSASPNDNEAAAAKAMADKLIDKHAVSPEELASIADKAPAYTENEKLFSSPTIISWMTQLALAIGNKFDCQIVQEEVVGEDKRWFDYYVLGDPIDVQSCQIVWLDFSTKVEQLIAQQCLNRGPVYIASYAEGMMESVKQTIQYGEFELPIKRDALAVEAPTVKPDAIVAPILQKEKPPEARYDVKSGSLVQDIMAYFRGIEDGQDIRPTNQETPLLTKEEDYGFIQ